MQSGKLELMAKEYKSLSKTKRKIYSTPKTNPAKYLNNNTFANTDNIGHLFVTVFANRSCSLESFVKQDKPGPHNCFQ